jgi:hypothetical protein
VLLSREQLLTYHSGRMLEFTDWAKEILRKADEAARRLNPDARIRLAVTGQVMQAQLAEQPAPGDRTVEVNGVAVLVEEGISGLVDIEEPHDRIVLKPAGSPHNVREPH